MRTLVETGGGDGLGNSAAALLVQQGQTDSFLLQNCGCLGWEAHGWECRHWLWVEQGWKLPGAGTGQELGGRREKQVAW